LNQINNRASRVAAPTRRRLISGMAFALGSVGIAWPEDAPETMQERPSTGANKKRTSLHLDMDVKLSPARVYEVLLDEKQFAACTGLPAEIDPKAGGAFSMFKGQIVGRNIELIPAQRVVQAWRPAHWPPGIYSIVRFELKPQGSGTLIALDHTGFPEGDFDSLKSGWRSHYWEPLNKLAS
jgi:activator of HSP90 ATPase